MKCHEVEGSLAAYLHGEVGRSERELIRAHIAACEHCQREAGKLAEMQAQMSHALRARAGSAGPSPQAWLTLQDRLTPRRQPGWGERLRHALGWAQPAGSMLTRAVLVCAGVATISIAALSAWRPEPAREMTDAVGGGVLSVPAVTLPARRMSGPLEGQDMPERHVVQPAHDVSSIAGTWLFLQGSADEGPWRVCPTCAQLQ